MLGRKVKGFFAAAGVGAALTLGACSNDPFPKQAQLNSCINRGILPKDIGDEHELTATIEIATIKANGEHVALARISTCKALAGQKIDFDATQDAGNRHIGVLGIAMMSAVAMGLASR